MNNKEKNYKWIFDLWLIVSAFSILFFSWNRKYLPGANASQGFGLIVMGLLLVLSAISFFTGQTHWIALQKRDEEKASSSIEQKRTAVKQFIFSTIIFLAFLLYCLIPFAKNLHTDRSDAIFAAVLICLSVLPVAN